MEGFLRAYYTNLNPNATEEEILAYLASQGFEGMGNQPIEGGITTLQQNPMLLPQMGGEDPNTPFRGTGTGSILDFIKSGGLFGAATRGIEDLFQNFADKRAGRLDITPDSAIMPTGIEIGAAQGSDAGFDNSDYIGNANDGTSNAGTGSSDDGFF